MTKRKVPGKRLRDRGSPFIMLPMDMLNGQAYRDLAASSAKALPYFLAKVKTALHDPVRYTAPFSITYREAGKYGFSPATFSRVIKELVAKGFIDPVEKGGLRSDRRSSNLFRLSRRWENFGKPAFEEIPPWEQFAA